MTQQRDIHKIQLLIFMQRLYAHLLILKYFELLSKRNSSGNKTTLLYPNAMKTTYTYDAKGDLIDIITQKAISTYKQTYQYDKTGNRTSYTEPSGIHTYTYDPTYQLLSADHTNMPDENYTYDQTGNRLNTTVDPANRLTEDANHTYTYDNNGNLIRKTHKITGIITQYTYDFENRLIKITLPLGITAEYKYDPFGRRMEKKVESIDKGVAETSIQTYVYDNEDIIFKYITKTSNGATTTETKKYLHGPGIDEHLSLTNDTGTYYYHADGLGSIIALTDASGTVAQAYEYDSFGNLHDSMNAIKQPYTFTGREWDKEIGLYYYRARYYDAETGRFVSFDPILRGFSHVEEVGCRESITSFPLEQPQKLHPYAYVENNPLNLTDASGLCPKVPDITFVQTAIRTGQTPVQITYLISCTLVKSEKVKIGSKCFEKCSYNCKQSWSWVAPESGKTFGGKTTFPKQYEFERDANECCE